MQLSAHVSLMRCLACHIVRLSAGLRVSQRDEEHHQLWHKVPGAHLAVHHVQERNGNVVIADTQQPIIERLSRQAFVSDRQRGALVLGFKSAEGAKSMVDSAVGKVSGMCIGMLGWLTCTYAARDVCGATVARMMHQYDVTAVVAPDVVGTWIC